MTENETFDHVIDDPGVDKQSAIEVMQVNAELTGLTIEQRRKRLSDRDKRILTEIAYRKHIELLQ